MTLLFLNRLNDTLKEYFYRSTNNGASFDSTKNLSNNAGFSSDPQIAVSGKKVYVVWHKELIKKIFLYDISRELINN
jgi:hypothetical protein